MKHYTLVRRGTFFLNIELSEDEVREMYPDFKPTLETSGAYDNLDRALFRFIKERNAADD